jgi:microcystin-dependent protein
MSVPFLSEIRIMSFGFPPKGWAQCNGQLLPINQYQALFSLLGTAYGGDGRTTFGLPNLQAPTAIHGGDGQGLGRSGGEQAHTLVTAETPSPPHTHTVMGATTAGDAPIPAGNYLGAADNLYAPLAHTTPLPAATVANAGGQPHNNMQPYLVLNFCIALQGIYPSRN